MYLCITIAKMSQDSASVLVLFLCKCVTCSHKLVVGAVMSCVLVILLSSLSPLPLLCQKSHSNLSTKKYF